MNEPESDPYEPEPEPDPPESNLEHLVGDLPDKVFDREPEPFDDGPFDWEAGRLVLAYLIVSGFIVVAIMVTAGGLAGVFDPTLVGAVVAIYTASVGCIAAHYFRPRPPHHRS